MEHQWCGGEQEDEDFELNGENMSSMAENCVGKEVAVVEERNDEKLEVERRVSPQGGAVDEGYKERGNHDDRGNYRSRQCGMDSRQHLNRYVPQHRQRRSQ